MAQKTVAWKDDSGDNITLTADAWSGAQQVTVQTPENFGKYRALNIVFYSVADATKSATLKVTQEAATALLSPNTVVFDNTETTAKTITLSTNISTLSSTSIALEGADASQFTLSALSALSNGEATFTIKPNSVNQGTSSRNCSITVTVGRLDVMNIPVEQLADVVVETEYLNYRLDGQIIKYDGFLFDGDIIVTVPAAQGTLSVQGQVVRDKKVTYASGRVETTTENVPSSNTIYYSVRLRGVDSGDDRAWLYSNTTAGAFTSGVDFTVPSLQYTLFVGEGGSLGIGLSDKSIQTEDSWTEDIFDFKENKRTGYSDYSNTNLPNKTVGVGGGSVSCTASAYGTCTYSSGASRTENVPMTFGFVESVSWASITSQTPGAAGTSLASSSCTIYVSGTEYITTVRTLSLSVRPRLADGSTGGGVVGYITVTQSATSSIISSEIMDTSGVGMSMNGVNIQQGEYSPIDIEPDSMIVVNFNSSYSGRLRLIARDSNTPIWYIDSPGVGTDYSFSTNLILDVHYQTGEVYLVWIG